jgi:hypothetical protein
MIRGRHRGGRQSPPPAELGAAHHDPALPAPAQLALEPQLRQRHVAMPGRNERCEINLAVVLARFADHRERQAGLQGAASRGVGGSGQGASTPAADPSGLCACQAPSAWASWPRPPAAPLSQGAWPSCSRTAPIPRPDAGLVALDRCLATILVTARTNVQPQALTYSRSRAVRSCRPGYSRNWVMAA